MGLTAGQDFKGNVGTLAWLTTCQGCVCPRMAVGLLAKTQRPSLNSCWCFGPLVECVLPLGHLFLDRTVCWESYCGSAGHTHHPQGAAMQATHKPEAPEATLQLACCCFLSHTWPCLAPCLTISPFFMCSSSCHPCVLGNYSSTHLSQMEI